MQTRRHFNTPSTFTAKMRQSWEICFCWCFFLAHWWSVQVVLALMEFWWAVQVPRCWMKTAVYQPSSLWALYVPIKSLFHLFTLLWNFSWIPYPPSNPQLLSYLFAGYYHLRVKNTVFTRFVPHPQIVPHCGTILSLFLEIMLIVLHPRIVPHHIFCKHLLLVLPYLNYSYPSQCK